MKNRFKLLGIIVLTAVIGFTLTACANGTNGNDDDNSGAYVSYFGSDSLGNGYVLEIGSGVPKAGDSYEFTKTTSAGAYKSVGTVSSVSPFILIPAGGSGQIVIPVSGNKISGTIAVIGTVTLTREGGGTEPLAAVAVNPHAPGWISQADLNSTYFGVQQIYDKDNFSNYHTTPNLTDKPFNEGIDGNFPRSAIQGTFAIIGSSNPWSFNLSLQAPGPEAAYSDIYPFANINNLNVVGTNPDGRLTCAVGVSASPLLAVEFYYAFEDFIIDLEEVEEADGTGVLILEKGWNLVVTNKDTDVYSAGRPASFRWIWRPLD
jgi:hypothetical protein